jgi:SsrA-binding protein
VILARRGSVARGSPHGYVVAAMARGKPETGEFIVCTNVKALRAYEIEERLEAGMLLGGSEVKSLRARHADLDGSYASIDGGELFLHKMHIGPYLQAGAFGHEPTRSRKLLAHRQEIKRLIGKLAERGHSLVPLRVYFKGRRAKVELGLGKGRRKGDRRDQIRRDIDMREARSAMARRRG